MCGINAVLLKRGNNAPELAVLIARKQTERGTSSTGVAWLSGNEVKLKKQLGPPAKFEVQAKSYIAIGHNRAPSVGKITVQNAHPFMSCDKSFALVHNGTFTNYLLIKTLLNGKHQWEGETDSEVLMHCVEELKERGIPMEDILELINERLLILHQDGSIWGYSDGELEIIEDESGFYVANTKQAIREVIGEKEVKVYDIVGSFQITKKGIRAFGRCVVKKEQLSVEVLQPWQPPWYNKWYEKGGGLWSKYGF